MRAAEAAKEPEVMNSKIAVLDVTGMTCPSCVRHVNAALADIEGVAKVEVRLRDGKVHIQYDPELVSLDTLIEALHEAGYEAEASAAA
jgi:copper chaperone